MLRFMGYVGPEVSAHDAMPGGVVLLVELLLNECLKIINIEMYRNILLNVELLQSLISAIDSILLHFLTHVSILDNCLSVCLGHFQLF